MAILKFRVQYEEDDSVYRDIAIRHTHSFFQLHDAILAGGKKAQTTRYLKVTCTCCGWQARVTAKHLEGRTLRCPDENCEGELGQAA